MTHRDPSQIKRGQPGNAGQFRDHEHTAPETVLDSGEREAQSAAALYRSEHVGAWEVRADGDGLGRVEARRRDSDTVYSTSLIRFPVGYRVGQRWMPADPPKSVITAARRLARTF